jgi:hypothetical protein
MAKEIDYVELLKLAHEKLGSQSDMIAELERNILMLEQYNGGVESLIKDIKAHNLDQQANGAIKLTNLAMKKLQSPKCSQSRLEYFKAGVRALAFAIDKESKALKEQE